MSELARSHTRGKLAVLGVAVGVSFFGAAQAINSSVPDAFHEDATALAGAATLTVQAGETGFPASKLAMLRDVEGVHAAVPMVVARVRLEHRPVVLLGIDRLAEHDVRSYSEPLSALDREDSILVAARLARKAGIRVDGSIPILGSFGTRHVHVRGVLEKATASRAFGGNVAVMDIDAARVLLGRRDLVDRVDLVPEDGVATEVLRTRVRAVLGAGYRVERPAEEVARRLELVADYQGSLSLFAGLALLVSIGLVAHTVVVSAAERRRELTIRRALGARRWRIVAQLVTEAGVIGFLGAIAGVPLAHLLGRALLPAVSASMTFQYATPIDVTVLRFSSSQAATVVAMSTCAAVLAALVPAIRSAQVRGEDAFTLSIASSESRRVRLGPAVGLVALAGLLVPFPPVLYPVLAAIGTALVASWLVELTVTTLAWATRRAFSGVVAVRLAAQNITRDRRSMARTSFAIVVGLMFIVITGGTHASIETSIVEWEVRTLRSDAIATGPGRIGALQVQPLHESLAAQLDAIGGVDVSGGRGVRAYRFVRLVHERRPIALKAIDPQHPRVGSAVFDLVDRPADDAMRELFAPGDRTAMVSENFVRRFGQKTGDTIALDTPSGRTRFRVVGVMVDFASPNGVVYLSRATYRELWHDPLVTAFMIEAAPGVRPEDLRQRIDAALGDRGVDAISVEELRAQTRQTLDEAFVTMKAIRAVAFLVGLLGLSGALLVSLMDRLSELASLRRSGVTRRQVLGMVVVEATILGGAGGLVAAALGMYVSRVWAVRYILSALGWQIDVITPFALVGLTIVTGLAIGLTAGLLSARRVAPHA